MDLPIIPHSLCYVISKSAIWWASDLSIGSDSSLPASSFTRLRRRRECQKKDSVVIASLTWGGSRHERIGFVEATTMYSNIDMRRGLKHFTELLRILRHVCMDRTKPSSFSGWRDERRWFWAPMKQTRGGQGTFIRCSGLKTKMP